jgi:hypothetical protein
MDIVSVVAFAGFIVGLIACQVKIKQMADEASQKDNKWSLLWISRIFAFGATLCFVWVIDAHFWKIPNPFNDPPAAELKEKPDKIKEPEPLELEAPDSRPNMDEVREEHRDQLDDFEKDAKQ